MFTKHSTVPHAGVAYDKAFKELDQYEATSEEYATILNRIKELNEIISSEESTHRVSPDTKAVIGANLAGIAMVLGYEHAHVITTKAFGLLLKPR